MKILLLGNGGREHALGRALAGDPEVSELHVAPGNPGLAAIGTLHAINPADPDAVVTLARALGVDLVVVGPEAPLVAGVADALVAAGIDCFGPSAQAAVLEGSKAFAKEVMAAAGVPTAASRLCETPEQAAAALDEFGATHVVKNDGLAAGKGVVVTDDRAAALAHAAACGRVVIEDFLDGPEVSLFAICDGERALPLLPAQDFKRVGDGDAGPNTGGMGAYAPLPWAPRGLVEEIMTAVVDPTLAEMRRRGTPFVGLLYAGLALTSKGLRVVEFNVRFGDPETQAVLALLETPLGGVLRAAARGELDSVGELKWRDGAAVVVVSAAEGYPGTPRSGGHIELPADGQDAWVLQAGTTLDGDRLVASGGRVLGTVGRGVDLEEARERAYAQLGLVGFADGFHRTDIGIPH
ncbi:phosphoribosylamine--glycine ligase [Tessaracoccus rhinocerotis]|uniref:Phosphoribosylamine--glycine ligase n=1 Tax=Tessaracoccus rhinocerotis TaxID=1689449 RepID=A0A553K5Q9_9ACTN|nr:phosphoribosylamine--glycine ligase [Tessaracoccus rhinocerotis]TRY20045.1 phosphoribosylamine--glycine ligase [Tessaracoccus rhinocerotis]